ncbi:MAG: hypothetical protein KGL12_13765 [Rhodospirillales bacterium]|nr:hypothetical protein [Rhodospirillales bacterium]
MDLPASQDAGRSGAPAQDVELIAVIAAVAAGMPCVLTIEEGTALPSGPFVQQHRSLQSGLRLWVEAQTGHDLGYVEQLYTFADQDRQARGRRMISISYLGLARAAPGSTGWQSWYRYFPWEDRRDTAADTLPALTAALGGWAMAAGGAMRERRLARIAVNFATDGRPWNEELVLQRYELLYEAGLVTEAGAAHGPGIAMAHDHRRILATGIARLRAKIKYRPVVFELMAPEFTLLELQKCVEALAGRPLHKQNFRRLIEQQELVEETGQHARETGGRPAKRFRFRRAVLAERAAAGTKLPLARG